MADVKQCDRCKNYYTERTVNLNSRYNFGSIAKGCLIHLSKFRIIGTKNETKYYDLCDDCLTKLYEFLESEKNND